MLKPREQGATAVILAAGIFFLIGMAALAIDLGAGFTERRNDQTSVDVAALAGGLSAAENSGDAIIVQQVLDFARANLTQSYTDPEWQAMWQACVDPGRVDFELRDGSLTTFLPLQEPAAWGANDLDCISRGSSFLRVQLPDQIADTSFAKVIGSPTLSTQASAVVLIDKGDSSGLLPFGIEGGTGPGETCLTSAPAGIAALPCTGSSGGSFGPIRSELFGEYRGTPDCGNPTDATLTENIALGIDHFIGEWPNPGGSVSEGDLHPGPSVTGYAEISRDACRLQAGTFSHQFGEDFPVNTLLVDTGFPSGAVESGLISNNTFFGSNSRLQQPCTASQCGPAVAAYATRDIVKVRNGSGSTIYAIDNVGPWEFLTGTGVCDPTSYSPLTTDQKVNRFSSCLGAGQANVFSPEIEESPRFAFAPRYWHQASTSGTTWQPVKDYDAVFLAGLWFNCDGTGSCALYMYPDSDATGELCDPNGPSFCHSLSLDQLSGWVIPDAMLPGSITGAFPGGFTPFTPTIYD